ncbi:MAG: FumA C-terminus/TtdB family hydratase beta subunit [Actinobacteria bacterium]|nr:FumA C-terminus/TtdB family hydratase beta subunit [Actinomycetota bacterium]
MKKLRLPPEPEVLQGLSAGDEVLLTGDALTLRDAALARMEALAAQGAGPPFELAGELVFYAAPPPAGAGRPCAAIGPTTSARMDRFLPLLLASGVVAVLGKGPRGEEARAKHQEHGVVYFTAVGGIAALLGSRVDGIETVAWEDLGPEAVRRVSLSDFPVVVAIDSAGRDYLAGQRALYRRDKQ